MSAVGTATFFGGLLLAKLINYASRSSTSPSIPISIALLHDQDSNTSTAIISNFASSSDFIKLSKFEGDQISSRDSEDSTKLDEGIAIARAKSAIPSNYTPEPYTKIDVLGKSASFVANEMLSSIPLEKSFVLVLCGLSGTGKGTTVAQLKSVLTQKHGKKVTTWSNGNIFRSVTYLAAMYCLKNGKKDFDASFCLTPKLLKGFLGMLSFGQINGKFDIKVESKELGVSMLVGDVCNTVLKEPIVAKNIPTVAQVTQGEVISFAAGAIQQLEAAGEVVLLEGREQTVDYVRTPHRFILTLSDESLIGKRRAAQRVGAAALKICLEKEGLGVDVGGVMREVVKEMASNL
ncbi:hypothetical protein ScalyP_jg9633 [Parmales sp. scaly parma]|nr:hypothetical protein ScalyP_jg9633 [Parmales sp. scaly parma]